MVVQSAASREIVVGLNASSRGAMKEGMENAQDGGGGKVVLIAESLPRVYIAAVAASRESSTASSYTTPTASYFRVLSVPFGYPITERGGFLPPPSLLYLCLLLSLFLFLAHFFTRPLLHLLTLFLSPLLSRFSLFLSLSVSLTITFHLSRSSSPLSVLLFLPLRSHSLTLSI